jgi:hypothetical protein
MVSPLRSLHHCECRAFLFCRTSTNKLESQFERTVEIYDAILYETPVLWHGTQRSPVHFIHRISQ